ncbi:flagellar biosynthetic protein FliQ [bacterium]|nr:flagellar biosynthetic protein FliQ [bacterium]
MEILMEYMARGFIVMLSISMPCVLVAAGIGLVVGILQAVTQVQEQTIAAAPKILAVFLVIIVGGVGFVRILTNLFSDGMAIAFNVVPKNDSYVLPSDYYKYTRPFLNEMNKEPNGKNSTNFKNLTNNKPSFSGKFRNDSTSNKKSGFFEPKADLLETQKIMQNESGR